MLKQTLHYFTPASQRWSQFATNWHANLALGILLPFILGPYVEYEDEYWKNYLLLLEITSIAFVYEFSLTMISYLQQIVDQYLTSFQSLYGTHLTPKTL